MHIIKSSEIKAMSANFVKERFGYSNLRSVKEAGIDVRSHRISFEAGISIILKRIGYVKDGKDFILNLD